MAYAINIRSDHGTAKRLESLWDMCCKLERVPSMQALGYPPHITLAVYDEVPISNLREGFQSALAALETVTIRFESLGYFQTPHAFVLWAAPNHSQQLMDAHAAIHSKIDISLCRANYRPGIWKPHSTLATAVPLGYSQKVAQVMEQPFHPIEVVFDVLDYAKYPPVNVLEETVLSA
jgi:2'-5' RNA ligase